MPSSDPPPLDIPQFLPRNRRERRAMKSAGRPDMRSVQLHEHPRPRR